MQDVTAVSADRDLLWHTELAILLRVLNYPLVCHVHYGFKTTLPVTCNNNV